MSNLDQVWANTQADGDFSEDKVPPAGYLGIVRVSGYRTGKSKKGELYFAVDVVDDQQDYNWGIYKQFTKNGQPHEGSIKSAKITLRQLGIDVQSPAQVEPMLKAIVGRYYSVEQTASDRISTTTGAPFVNTNITGVASPPSAPVAAPVAQAPVATAPPQAPQWPQQQATQVQTPQGVASFPPAVAPPVVQPAPTLDQVATGQVAPATAMQAQVQAAQAAPQVDSVPFQ